MTSILDEAQQKRVVKAITDILLHHPPSTFALSSPAFSRAIIAHLATNKKPLPSHVDEDKLTNFIKNTLLKRDFSNCPRFLEALGRASFGKINKLKQVWHPSVQAVVDKPAAAALPPFRESDAEDSDSAVEFPASSSSEGEQPATPQRQRAQRKRAAEEEDDPQPSTKVVVTRSSAPPTPLAVAFGPSAAPAGASTPKAKLSVEQLIAILGGVKNRLVSIEASVVSAKQAVDAAAEQIQQRH